MKQTSSKKAKLWGGRFSQKTNPLVEQFTASIHFDNLLAPYDLIGSKAWALALAKARVITKREANRLIQGLTAIGEEIARGTFIFNPNHEDIHMAIEARLIEKVGKVGEKLHTGRSRNDQVATDLRLFVKEALHTTTKQIRALQIVLLDVAKQHIDVVMPGYTHLQPAQPVLFAHHLLAYFEMLKRDDTRLQQAYTTTDQLPLGSGALAGTGFPIDRHALAKSLGFRSVTENSLDAVSDRDFVVETLHAIALGMVHLSRLAEEIILWNNPAFGFITLPDAFATGSSMMPQKKNPDIAELIRGKTGRTSGHLTALLTTLKGLPLSYNRDLQEDKEGLFDALATYQSSLAVLAAMLPGIKINKDRMEISLQAGGLQATDLADYLAKCGVPFREAHHIVGKLVQHAEKTNIPLAKLSLHTLQQFSSHFTKGALPLLSSKYGITLRSSYGGTSPKQVLDALLRARRYIQQQEGKK